MAIRASATWPIRIGCAVFVERLRSRSAAAFAVFAFLSMTPAAADAPAGRYTVNPPEVLDTATGLTWMMTAPTTGGDDGAGDFRWMNAVDHCVTFGAGWRLPTVKELLTIVDVSKPTAPTVDGVAFPATANAPFWSSTPLAGTTNQAWFVTFDYGGTGTDFLTSAHRVRCVR